MAYERRRLINNLSGTLAARASANDSQITCQGSAPGIANVFAALPVDFTQTLYMPLVLANDATGKFEIVWVTGHASASPTLTVIRGREGTEQQTFEVGDTVRCAATVRDVGGTMVSTRSALPGDPHYGLRVLILEEGAPVVFSPLGWVDGSPLGPSPTRKHHWVQSGINNPNTSTPQTVSGLAAASNHTGTIASMASGQCVLNKAGLWTLSWEGYDSAARMGYVYLGMSWPNGAFPRGSTKAKTVARPAFQVNRWDAVEWTGYVSAAQAAQPITLQTFQQNADAAAISSNFDFTAEYLGA